MRDLVIPGLVLAFLYMFIIHEIFFKKYELIIEFKGKEIPDDAKLKQMTKKKALIFCAINLICLLIYSMGITNYSYISNNKVYLAKHLSEKSYTKEEITKIETVTYIENNAKIIESIDKTANTRSYLLKIAFKDGYILKVGMFNHEIFKEFLDGQKVEFDTPEAKKEFNKYYNAGTRLD